MNKVYLLGAGFSRAISASMPVSTELGDKLKTELGRTLPNEINVFGNDFEAWLTYLGTPQPWQSQETTLRHGAAFARVARYIHSRIQTAVIDACADRPPPGWSDKLIRNWVVADPDTFVITFNYDTLIELTWHHIARKFASPNAADLYGVPIPSVNSRYAGVAFVRQWQPFTLVKLHGSTNWYYAGLQAPNDTSIYYTDQLGSWESTRDAWDDAVRQQNKSVNVLDLDPLIVPPTLAKGPFYANRQLAAQWRLAARRLREAEELVCIGFSMPPADTMVRSLLATTFTGKIVLVDRDKSVSGRMAQLFGGHRVDDTFCGTDDAIQRYVGSLPNVSDHEIQVLPRRSPSA